MRWLVIFLVLGGCATPGHYFRDQPATRVAVHGSVFDVRRRGSLAEALRVNPQYAPRAGPIYDRAAEAMRIATGCPVRWVAGDQAMITGRLDCPDTPPVAEVFILYR